MNKKNTYTLLVSILAIGCSPQKIQLGEYARDEPIKYQYCTVGERVFSDFEAPSLPKPNTISDHEAKNIIKCMKKVTKSQLTNYRNRLQEHYVKSQADRMLIEEEVKRKKNAKDKLDLLRAQINVHPEIYHVEKSKLEYCETKPEWREHGVLVAKELARNNAYNGKSGSWSPKPEIILRCINGVDEERLAKFYLPIDKK